MSKPPIPFYFARSTCSLLFNTLVNLNVEGKENIPEDKQYILISNHLNWSDPFYIFSVFPPSPRIVFTAEYDGIYDTPFKKKFIDLMGKPIVPIKRENTGSRSAGLKAMFRVVRNGNNLAIFPEGRLGHEEGELFPFHVGIFSLAKRLGVPILPVAISGSKDLSLRKPIQMKIGELEYCKSEESDEDFARRMARVIKDLIPAYPGDGPFPNTCNWMTGLCQGDLRPFEGEDDLIIKRRNGKRNREV